MKILWRCSLALSVGICTVARGGEAVKWTAVAPTPQGTVAANPSATVTIETPIAGTGTTPVKYERDAQPATHVDQQLVLPPFSQPTSTPQALPTIQYVDLPKDTDSPRPMPRRIAASRKSTGGPILDDSKPASDDIETIPPPRVMDPQTQGSGSGSKPPQGVVVEEAVEGEPVGEAGGFFQIPVGMQDNKLYVSADALLWWIRPSNYPALVTNGNPPATAIGDRGEPREMFPGFRLNFGYWFDPCHQLGMEGNVLYLPRQSTSQTVALNPIVLNPVNNPLINGAFIPAPAPLVITGSASARWVSEFFSAEANFRSNLINDPCCTLDGIAGFRYLGLKDDFSLSQTFTLQNTGASVSVLDSFTTKNQFYGPQVGFIAESRWRRFYLDGTIKLGMGVTHQDVNISGQTSANFTPIVINSGLFAQQGNIGEHSRNVFSVVPEIGLTVGMNVTEHLRVYAGYSFIYWTNVARPGEQINGKQNPQFAFHSTDFFAQGCNIGVEYRY